VVVDAGSAITVDFVDGEGTFQGGAIAPGARMMLRALHQQTAALPAVEFAAPEGAGDSSGDDFQPFGRNTPQAMLNGVFFGARGLVRQLAERYAEKYEAYPTIIATGGDAKVLFEGDDLVERIVPELTLRGVAHAFDAWLGTLDDSEGGDPPTEARDLAR
jgi:type III pantothenate kinase